MGHLPKSKAGIISKEHVCEGELYSSLYGS